MALFPSHDPDNLFTVSPPAWEEYNVNTRRNTFYGKRHFVFRQSVATTREASANNATRTYRTYKRWSKWFPVNKTFATTQGAVSANTNDFHRDAHSWIPIVMMIDIDPTSNPTWEQATAIPRQRVYFRFQQYFSADFDPN